MKTIRYLLFFLLIVTHNASAKQYAKTLRILTGTQLMDFTTPFTFPAVLSIDLTQLNTDNRKTSYQNTIELILRNHSAFNEDVNVVITAEVIYYMIDGSTPVTKPITLTINYKAGFLEKSKISDIYVFTNAYKVDLLITDVIVKGDDDADPTVLKQKLKNFVEIDVTFQEERITSIDYYAVVSNLAACRDARTDELVISWKYLTDAEEYELEYTFADNYGNNFSTAMNPGLIPYNFKDNSTRVSLKENYYRFPLLYERGYILYRVRAIGRGGANLDFPVFCEWSGGTDKGMVSNFPNVYYHPVAHMRDKMNWQVTSTFAEEGKRSDVVNYYDGTFRSRQTVTGINLERNAFSGPVTLYPINRPWSVIEESMEEVDFSDQIFNLEQEPDEFEVEQEFQNQKKDFSKAGEKKPGKKKDLTPADNQLTPVTASSGCYYPGSGKFREVVAGETIYDFQGRAAVTILPTPTNSAKIQFLPNLNISANSSKPYDWRDFDSPNYMCANANALSSFLNATNGRMGAAAYYSPNNPNKLGFNAFIPDAGGFPFTQVSYLQDNTGRVAAQGGVSEIYQLGKDHETKFYYAAPNQEELDQLFGTEAGDALRYQKNAVMDPNGQVSVTYLNPEGKTIATALAGETPTYQPDGDNIVDPLENQNDSTITVSLLNKNIINTDDKTMITEHQFLVTSDNTKYTFYYNIDPEFLETQKCDNSDICLDCIYDIEITLTHIERCTSTALFPPYSGTIGDLLNGNGLPDLHCNNHPGTGEYPREIIKFLNIGTYVITKKITVNKQAALAYVAEVYKDTCKSKWLEILENEFKRVNTMDCYRSCITCEEPPMPTPTCDTAYCDSLPNRCDILRGMMRADLSPGGQYAKFDRLPDGTIDASNYPLSIFNLGNHLPYQQTSLISPFNIPVILFVDIIITYFNDLVNDGTIPYNIIDLSYEENLTAFISNWRPEFAETLLILHPEYYKSLWCDKPDIEATLDFDVEILRLEIFDDAEAAGYISSGYPITLQNGVTYDNAYEQLLDADPWFIGNQNGYLRSQLQTKLQNYGCYGNTESADILAIEMAYCAYNNPVSYDEETTPQIDANNYPCNLPRRFSSGDFGTIDPNRDRDLEWTFLRALYLSAKNEVIEVSMEDFNSPGHNSCTICIGSDLFFDLGNIFVTSSFYLNTSPCNLDASFFYIEKERRFGSSLPTLVNAMNDENMTDYQSLTNPIDLCENAQNIIDQSENINNYVSDNLCGNSDSPCLALSIYAKAIKDYLNAIFQYRIYHLNFPSSADLLLLLPPVLQEQDGHPVYNVVLTTPSNNFFITIFYPHDGDDGPCNIELSGNSSWDWSKVRYIYRISPSNPNVISNNFTLKVLYGNTLPPPSRIEVQGSTSCWPMNQCADSITLCDTIPKLPRYNYKNNCVDDLIARAHSNAELRYHSWIDSSKNDLLNRYYAKCLAAVEAFDLTYTDREYHYTLYYYDQAGNLTKTVPPSGVHLLNSAQIAQVTSSRANGYNTPILPKHVKQTVYRYNTLNQPVWQKTPDAGVTEFYYDGLGRIAASQNAQQKEDHYFSYLLYDKQGRVVEAGKVKPAQPITTDLTRDFDGWTSFINHQIKRSEITLTCYDEPYTDAINQKFGNAEQRNLRMRVASVFSFDDATKLASKSYTHATHYTYDIMGNVYKLIQDYPNEIIGDKILEYDYDLQSGKVNSLTYQRGAPDQFMHRYNYDAANRLVRVKTSPSGLVWETDAEYLYYRHGPLGRLELGTDKVQGLDYMYTLQGFIKGVNGTTTSAAHDMGKDAIITPAPLAGTEIPPPPRVVTLGGQTYYIYSATLVLGPGFTGPGYGTMHNPVARDAFGYVLDYYENDYTPIEGNGCLTALQSQPLVNPLYNGNISRMYTQLQNFGNPDLENLENLGNMGFNYRYDQLNRLTSQEGWKLGGNDFSDMTLLGEAYKMKLKYDADGNILRLLRNGEPNKPDMDLLKYWYYRKNLSIYNPETGIPADATNKLAYITDQGTSANYSEDLDNQNTNNYGYNLIGNLNRDVAGGIDPTQVINPIQWNIQNKITRITKTDGTVIYFAYDALGNRIMKDVSGGSHESVKTFYVRDAQGNIISTYTYKTPSSGSTQLLVWEEAHLYGSSRIGLFRPDKEIPKEVTTSGTSVGPGITTSTTNATATNAVINFNNNLFSGFVCQQHQTAEVLPMVLINNITEARDSVPRGYKLYELTNHLGNVLATITDRKLPYDDGTYVNGIKQDNMPPDEIADFYIADVASCQDYYAFGMEMPGRKVNSSTYKFGFNGKLNDDEVFGEGNFQDYGFRMYDTRACRFISVDPLTLVYPWYSPYQFAGNTPIGSIDLEGAEPDVTNYASITPLTPVHVYNENEKLYLVNDKKIKEKLVWLYVRTSGNGVQVNWAYAKKEGKVDWKPFILSDLVDPFFMSNQDPPLGYEFSWESQFQQGILLNMPGLMFTLSCCKVFQCIALTPTDALIKLTQILLEQYIRDSYKEKEEIAKKAKTVETKTSNSEMPKAKTTNNPNQTGAVDAKSDPDPDSDPDSDPDEFTPSTYSLTSEKKK